MWYSYIDEKFNNLEINTVFTLVCKIYVNMYVYTH